MEEIGASSSSSSSSSRRRGSTITSTSTSSKEEGSCAGSSSWNPYGKAFRLYSPPAQPSTAGTPLASGRRPLVARLTKDIVRTYQICNPSFNFSETLNPKRFLTNPSTGLLNDGHDNENSDLILYVNLVLLNQEANRRYIVKDLLGQGTFGQVAKCCDLETNSYFAIKIIKNQPAYSQQALVEVSLLYMLNRRFDPDDRHHIVRILDHFMFKNHLCISFEMLGSNLFELIKMNSFKGLSLNIVQTFSKQILQALILMKDAGIIHCDLKPENILISKSGSPTEIKVIDFGSACMEGRTIYSYIQSRYYRSPEVLIGYPYTTSIDMWSFGCIVAELFLGLPLFPGASEYDLLKRMIEILGGQPPDYLLRDAKNTKKFFKHAGVLYHLENAETAQENSSVYRVLTEEEYEARESKRPIIGKHYFNNSKLEDIIASYPYRKSLSKEEILKEKLARLALVDFLRGLVELDPGKRWSPLQASGHPFITGEPFRYPYHPPPETPQIPVIRAVTVEHNPGGGHWLAAGLSLQVSNVNTCLPHNSPHFQKVPMSYGSSYGSLGSHGSYNDNHGLGSSYGSYGDFNSLHSYYSPAGPGGFNPHMQVGGPFLGFSPDARHMLQHSHGNGFGTSPGGLRPLSLGASPSQFTPPNSQIPISSASPGKYGPTSPSRSGAYGVSLGKAAAVGQYNKSRHWGQPIMGMQPYESFQHGSVHCDGISVSYPDAQYQMHVGPHTSKTSGHSNWKLQMGSRNGASSSFSSTNFKSVPASRENASNLVMTRVSDGLSDKPELSSPMPDPADWDPNYSDESLLQEDNSDLSLLGTEFANAVHVSCTRNSAVQHASGRSRFSSSSFIPVNQRAYGSVHTHSLGEIIPSTTHDTHGVRPPHFSQKIPSRFCQQFDHQSNHIKSTDIHRGNHHQSNQPNYNMADSHSSTNVTFANSMPWGRVGHLLTSTTLPTCHTRPDC